MTGDDAVAGEDHGDGDDDDHVTTYMKNLI
jgi:hypothetical protein